MTYLEEMKQRNFKEYTEYSHNEFVFKSRLFGTQAGSVAHVLECRCVSDRYRVALEKFRKERCAENVVNFQVIDHDYDSITDARHSINNYLDSWHGAEEDHRQAGIEHYKTAMRNRI